MTYTYIIVSPVTAKLFGYWVSLSNVHRDNNIFNIVRGGEERYVLYTTFGPGIDAKSPNPFIPQHPVEMSKAGVKVPLLVGFNANEGSFFLNCKFTFLVYKHTIPQHTKFTPCNLTEWQCLNYLIRRAEWTSCIFSDDSLTMIRAVS
ncbi:hypothetical protein E2986_12279 [Frieseomelitta varia]|uniref:Carboxylesterase type B domain-containing protein n=1 Tax=Frieseomelitta varia TaxID=561572 RepID=A0A833RI76_9HYME|nr:hypothetical protein E2986_12279 [Frieseomelitta varia]